MKVAMRELVGMKSSLQKLIGKDLPIKTAFKLGKLNKYLSDFYAIFDENNTKLFRKYGEEKEKNKIIIKNENIHKFNAELEELMALEVEITLDKISLNELGDIQLSPLDISNLELLIEE